ncbi:UNVERIFIED_CONTAM: hypothetical protein ABID98_005872 [Brevibacillus sp. OAP136]
MWAEIPVNRRRGLETGKWRILRRVCPSCRYGTIQNKFYPLAGKQINKGLVPSRTEAGEPTFGVNSVQAEGMLSAILPVS